MARPSKPAADRHPAPDQTAGEEPPRPAADWPYLLVFLRRLLDIDGPRVVFAVGLQSLLGLIGGVTLLLIVPVLASLGIGGGEANWMSRAVGSAFSLVGIDFTLTTGVAAFLALVVIHALLRYRAALLHAVITETVGQSLRDRLHQSLIEADWSYLVRQRFSNLERTVHSDVGQITAATWETLKLVGFAIVAACHAALAFAVAPLPTLLTAVLGVALFLAIGGTARHARKTGQAQREADGALFAQVRDGIAGLRLIKSMRLEATQDRIFRDISERKKARTVTARRVVARTTLLHTVAAAAALSLLVLASVRWFGTSAVDLVVLAAVFARLMPILSSFQTCWINIRQALPCLAGYDGLLSDIDRHRTQAVAGEEVEIAFEREILLDRVRVLYPDAAAPALDDVSLRIPIRTTTAIVGPSGAGKSTLVDVLIGLLSPLTGTIAIDGVALEARHLRSWAQRIGYVPQHSVLIAASVRDNLVWYGSDPGEDAIWQALELASAADFVRRLPEGLDTDIGEGGVLISGGERQRLALARALLRQPEVLVLDEATSAVDNDTETRIHDALTALRGRLTLIVIAHRSVTIHDADLIVRLEHGRIVDCGTVVPFQPDPEPPTETEPAGPGAPYSRAT